MRAFLAVVAGLAAAFLVGCSDGSDGTPQDGGTGAHDAGVADAGASKFEILVLDESAPGQYPIAVAVAGERIGVAYFADTGGSPARQLRYVEPGSAPEAVADVDNVFGLSLAFDAEGAPLVAYLGGGSDDSLYWKQSDLALARRGAGGWITEILARESGEVPTGVATSDFGRVVGINPALLVDEAGEIFVAHRDIHGGQFPTDYQHSDIEVVEGRPGAWRRSVAVVGGNCEYGHGGVMSAALADGLPALAWSAQPGSALDNPQDVWFARRDEGGQWTEPKLLKATGSTHAGPVLGWSSETGYGIAVEDRSKGILWYLESANGTSWLPAEPIVGAGTGGWYPSLAFAPNGEPVVAYYVCSNASAATVCNPSEDALVLKRRRGGVWPAREEVVDPEGASWPRLALAGSKAVIAYKDPERTVLKVAVER